MGKKEDLQWIILDNSKEILMEWSECNGDLIHAIHFVPIGCSTLEIYIFYKNDRDILVNNESGFTDKIKKIFLENILKPDYVKEFGDIINFIVDSDENVVKNYEGSYFLRLR